MNPLGASNGTVGDLSTQGLKNDFNNIPQLDIETSILGDRVQPRQVTTGVMRGTQRIQSTDGSYMTLGEIPGTNGQFGIAYFDRNNNIVSKETAATRYIYDLNTGKNIMQDGLLPDGTYGWAVAADGYNVADGIS